MSHSDIATRRFVFTAMAVLGAVYYSFVGDKICYTSAQGEATETTTTALKAKLFESGFNNALDMPKAQIFKI